MAPRVPAEPRTVLTLRTFLPRLCFWMLGIAIGMYADLSLSDRGAVYFVASTPLCILLTDFVRDHIFPLIAGPPPSEWGTSIRRVFGILVFGLIFLLINAFFFLVP